MTVTTKQVINAYIDAVMARISAVSVASLGGATVSEGDQVPGYFEPPKIFVIPLIEGRDDISTKMSMGTDPSGGHSFPVSIVGYWKYTGRTALSDGLRPVRNYGYDIVDLFTGGVNETIEVKITDGAEVKAYYGHNTNPSLEVGYFTVGDYLVHYAIVKLNIVTGL